MQVDGRARVTDKCRASVARGLKGLNRNQSRLCTYAGYLWETCIAVPKRA